MCVCVCFRCCCVGRSLRLKLFAVTDVLNYGLDWRWTRAWVTSACTDTLSLVSSDRSDQERHSTRLVRTHSCWTVMSCSSVATLCCSNVNACSARVTFFVQDVHPLHGSVCVWTRLHSGMLDTLMPHSFLASHRPSLVLRHRMFGGWNAARARCVSHSYYAWSAVIRASTPLTDFTAVCSLHLPFRTLSAIPRAPLSSVMKSPTVDSEWGTVVQGAGVELRRRCRRLTNRKRMRRIFSGRASQGLHGDLY